MTLGRSSEYAEMKVSQKIQTRYATDGVPALKYAKLNYANNITDELYH